MTLASSLMAVLLLYGMPLADAAEPTDPALVREWYEQMCTEVEIHPPVSEEQVIPEIGNPLRKIIAAEERWRWKLSWGWPSAAEVIEACQNFRRQHVQP